MKTKSVDSLQAKGFIRLKIGKPNAEGRVVQVDGDSGFQQNTVVNLGFQYYLVQLLGGIAGSSQLTYVALGTGTGPAVTDTSLNGELTDAAGCRCAITPSVVASKTLQCAFTLNSNVITANRTLQNVGLFATSTTSAGSMFSATTYATSQLQTNQAVNGTYQIRFS
jgi:hypothetical protein